MRKKQRSPIMALVLVAVFGVSMFAIGTWLSTRLQGDPDEAPSLATSAPRTQTTTPDAGGQTTPPVDSIAPDEAPVLTDEEAGTDEAVPVGPIVRPELQQIKEFVPEGGRFVRYWYSNMNTDEYDEVLFGYLQDGEVHIAALGVLDQNRYHVLWDEVTPGSSLNELITSKMDGKVVIRVETSQGVEGGFFALYEYADSGWQVLLFEQGPNDKANSVIALSPVTLAELSALPFSASVEGKVLTLLSGPIITAGDQTTVTEDRYEFREGVFVFVSEEQVEYNLP